MNPLEFFYFYSVLLHLKFQLKGKNVQLNQTQECYPYLINILFLILYDWKAAVK